MTAKINQVGFEVGRVKIIWERRERNFGDDVASQSTEAREFLGGMKVEGTIGYIT